jgi:DNA-binding SARP family transcriptional activator
LRSGSPPSSRTCGLRPRQRARTPCPQDRSLPLTGATQSRERIATERGAASASLSLLNGFELRCAGEPVALPLSAQRLLAFLGLQDRPLQRVYVAGMLWTEATDTRAAASLRSSLWRLHRPGHRLVEGTATHLRLAPEVEVDLHRAAAVARRVLDGTAETAELARAETALAAELLPDWYDDWLVFERERFRQLGLHALEELARRFLAAGRPARALGAALAAVRGEPLRESAHRTLIRVHLAEGNVGEALRQYELFSRLLREQLGLAPSPLLDELVAPLVPSPRGA